MLTISKTCPPMPAEAKAEAERLTKTLSGEALHLAFDQASNQLLSSLGYGDFVEEFMKATEGGHATTPGKLGRRTPQAVSGGGNHFPRMFVVFDLDGTLADGAHREHHITKPVGEKDWRSYFAACDQDAPKREIISILRALMLVGHHCEIWTGRSDEVRDKTRAWLCANGMAALHIRQRQTGDHTNDDELKRQWMERHGKPDLVFEDRSRVVSMWREHGVTCCQVAPGDF